MVHLQNEINEQPDVIRTLLQEESAHAAKIAKAIRDFDPTFVLIAARGTSDNAGRYAQYLMSIQARLPVALATPSVHTLYEAPPKLSRALVVGISQSGQSPDIGQVVKDAQSQGALAVSITNNADSPLAKSADYHLYLHAGLERSVAATKTYTTELTAVAMLTTALVGNEALSEQLSTLPQKMKETLLLSEKIIQWVERYRYMERIAVIGRGYNYCTAYEISLKLKELCYLTGQEYSEADFRHGPIAVVEQGFPVLTVTPKGKTSPVLVDLLKQLKERKAESLIVSNDPDAYALAQNTMYLPENLPEWLSPICAVVPGQVFARHLAEVKGYPLDEPRGLTKVTLTV